MKEIEAANARGKFDELLNRVEDGEEIVITRDGRVAARLLPPLASFDRAKALAAAAAIKAMGKGVTLGGLSIKDLIDEGRR